MRQGDCIGDRFQLIQEAGGGGMGTIWRGIDLATNEPVAIKLLQPQMASQGARFLQEAQSLARLSHPAIVRYVAHGMTGEGPFLVMEWLDGEDLGARLARAPLPFSQAIEAIRRAAEGLAVAHAAGLVHRDVKPSNLFLVHHKVDQLKVLDFGIARLARGAQGLTRTGTVLGTVGYMAPEQASGARDVDPRADVFSLGAVLFECLTGRPVFAAEHLAAMLARVLYAPPPRLRDLRPDLPAQLDATLNAMLAKSPVDRPSEMAAILRVLNGVEGLDAALGETVASPPMRVTGAEQRLMTAMLIVLVPPQAPDATLSAAVGGKLDGLLAQLRQSGSEASVVADGSVLAFDAQPGSADEQALRVAACALAVADAFPQARIALAMGNAESGVQATHGPVASAAGHLLPEEPSIRLDPVLARLLARRFEIAEHEGNFELSGRGEAEQEQKLLGRPSPCLGRDKELGLLEATLEEAIDEEVPRVVLVTAPPGAGKTRLYREFAKRALSRGLRPLLAQADAVSAGTSMRLVRQLVRRASNAREGDPPQEQRERLLHHLQGLGCDEYICEFLVELLGLPSDETPSLTLRAARDEPRLMRDAMAQAFDGWLQAELSDGPRLVILDDLHWGDLASVELLDEALRKHARKGWMLLALARPQVHDVFPGAWSSHHPHEIKLANLPRKAAERLIRSVLGDNLPVDALAKLVERSEGNAFFLEELIRGFAAGASEKLPATVLAMVQARIGELPPAARLVLRAASVYGESFWSKGVSALLDGSVSSQDAEGWLRTLVEREFVIRRPKARLPGQHEYAFRHALLRDAAYEMLPLASRAAGHLVAAEWLESAGETSPLALAEHFSRSPDPDRAVPWLLRATQEALRANMLEQTIALAERGMALRAAPSQRGLLMVAMLSAEGRLGNYQKVVQYLEEVRSLVPRGGSEWSLVVGGVFGAAAMHGLSSSTLSALQEWLDPSLTFEKKGPVGWAAFVATAGCAVYGQAELARAVLGRLPPVGDDAEPVYEGWRLACDSLVGLLADYDMLRAQRQGAAAQACFASAREELGWVSAAQMVGSSMTEAGDWSAGFHFLSQALLRIKDAGAFYTGDWIQIRAIQALRLGGQFEEALTLASTTPASESPIAKRFRKALQVQILTDSGKLDEAEAMFEPDTMRSVLVAQIAAARFCSARRMFNAAEHYLARGTALAERGGHVPSNVTDFLLIKTEVFLATRRQEEARQTIRAAQSHLQRVASMLDTQPGSRELFFDGLSINRRVLELAADLGEATGT